MERSDLSTIISNIYIFNIKKKIKIKIVCQEEKTFDFFFLNCISIRRELTFVLFSKYIYIYIFIYFYACQEDES